MTDSERLNKLIEYLKLNPLQFSLSLGHKRGDRVYNILKNRNGISSDLAREITTHYNNIRFDWLLTGEGEMLKADQAPAREETVESGKLYDIILMQQETISKLTDRLLKFTEDFKPNKDQ
jgi:hypothetical protein